MKLLDLYSKMKQDIQIIERSLEASIATSQPELQEASVHLLKAGGKRIRPVFVLLSGKFGHYSLEALEKVAVPLELIHMASLVHDDVIDDASTRRGQATVKAKWDNKVAMYTGDFIYARAMMVVTELQDPAIHNVLSKAIVQMCIGEMEQIRYFFNVEQSVRDYMLRIRRKTALLIAVSCQLGAMASQAEAQHAASLYRFGYNVGMAFQIRDDLLDICGTEKQIGKPPGSDIRQGNITLPVLLAMRDERLRERLVREIRHIQLTGNAASVASAIALIRGSSAIQQAEELADRYIGKAIAALSSLPNIGARKNLADIAHFVAKRTY